MLGGGEEWKEREKRGKKKKNNGILLELLGTPFKPEATRGLGWEACLFCSCLKKREKKKRERRERGTKRRGEEKFKKKDLGGVKRRREEN